MSKYRIIANKNIKVGKIEDTMYSSFIEHLGRAVYHGIYEPTHPTADENGFRDDVAKVIADLDLAMVRYPGGNFVSGYFWEDGIGPRDKRPEKREDAWHSIEPNIVGTDEFMQWCKKVGTNCMMALNLGLGTVENARNHVEYCNSNGDGKYANLRRKYGAKDAYGIKYWCLGNEMDGEWQIGHMPVADYVAKAKETAKQIKEIDKDVKFIACGSSMIDMPTFPSWDRQVLEGLYEDIDFLSVHQYFFESTTEANYYASYLAIEKYISTLRNVLGYAKANAKSQKDIYLCFDEYNVWYNNKPLPEGYSIAPAILEENQSLKDTIVFGGLINSLLNNCDVVKVACLAQLINVIAPIMTENDGRVLLNGIYYPFYNATKNCRGEAYKNFIVEGDTFESRYGTASYISSSITGKDDKVTVNFCNYAKDESEVEITLGDFGKLTVIDHQAIFGDDLNARNTFDNPNAIVPQVMEGDARIEGDKLIVKLHRESWNTIHLKLVK